LFIFFFFSSRRRHTRSKRDWSSDVCSSDLASAIIMLAGIYYGGMYGGRIPSILLRLPGDSSAVITTLDGYPLAKQGKAGAALTRSEERRVGKGCGGRGGAERRRRRRKES